MPSPVLHIRPAQMAALGELVDRKFIDALELEFSRLYPGIEGMRDRIVAIKSRADRYGIVARDDVRWFINLDLVRGLEWELAEEMDWAMDILDNPLVDVASRRYRLEKWMKKWDGDAT